MNDISHDCRHDGCGACCRNGAGSDCHGTIMLLKEEIELLQRFAVTPFLPVVRQWDSDTPIYLEENTNMELKISQSITGLQQKQLIRVDYDYPLSNFDYEIYRNYPIHGSMALTAKGQQVLELLEIYGIEE